MNENPFVLDKKQYRRDINVLKHYVDDAASYLQHMTGKPLPECEAFVKNSLKQGGQFQFRDPEITYFYRGDNGDRVEQHGTLHKYLTESIKDKELIAPTLTTYLNPAVKKSVLVDFIDDNIAMRNKARKEMYAARSAKNKPLETFKKQQQAGKKISNNSLSGAHVSASTPLYNKTAHSTLTSNCRSTSGYGNANNEKFLCGNRHYWSPDIVRNNIISIINHSDYVAFEAVMRKHNLKYPSVEEVMDSIKYSTNLYWRSKHEMRRIQDLVSRLNDLERAAFLYTGDMYHLMKLNESMVRDFLTRLSTRVDTLHPDPVAVFKRTGDDYHILALELCAVEVEGRALDKLVGTPTHAKLASTIENIEQTVQDHADLIRAFWVTVNLPASLAVFPDSIRRSAITSDTDSTIFTVQDWVLWYCGKITFSPTGKGIAAAMIFLAAQTITHVLARMSANFGIEEKRLHQIAMKNEFKFDVFVPTQVAKHYYAMITRQEAALFAKPDTEIKGVHLKSSNAPKFIMKEAERMMVHILDTVYAEKKLSIDELLKWVADLERGVVASIEKGSYEYFKRAQIKTKDSYKNGEQTSTYQQYSLWNEIFGPKYGMAPPPPYSGIKVSVDLDRPAKVLEWVSAIEDKELANRVKAWLTKKNRKHIGSTLILPEQCISSRGIPKEILDAIGVRSIVRETTTVFYLLFESLGIYMLNDKTTRLVMDEH